jgi:hypothetical protein
MKGALNEKTFGAIEAPAEELDHVLAHQERRKRAPVSSVAWRGGSP